MIVNIRGFIDPRWWNTRPAFIIARTQGDEFRSGGQTFYLAEDSVPDGTELYVDLNTFRAYEKDKRDEWLDYKQMMKDHNETVYNFKLALKRKQAEEFNSKIGQTFRWYSAIKEKLSGLSKGSDGTGWYKRTVVHIAVDQNWLKRGRFKRSRDEFLCTQRRGRFHGVQAHEYWMDDKGEMYDAKVTCQACIDRARKIDRAVQYKSQSSLDLDAESNE